MALQQLAQALERAKTALRRRPDLGLHDDAPATASWQEGTRIIASHANGTRLDTDMPAELGGSGACVTPGWLFRAGLASCAATTIAMGAAAEGIVLTLLEITARSRSDTRGLLGLPDRDGEPVYAGPGDVQLHVRIAARDVSAQCLRDLVQAWHRRAPIGNAVEHSLPIALTIEPEPH